MLFGLFLQWKNDKIKNQKRIIKCYTNIWKKIEDPMRVSIRIIE
jgi:hypothetical protein